MAKREVVNRGWLLDAQSSKKLRGQWKKASSLGMHLSAKYSEARLPTMYPIARSILAIPHTSCDVERSFSVWKRVRSEKQQSMKEGTQKAYVSFCFNGVVPPP